MKKLLITGVGNGLGKYLHENITNSIGLNRNNFNKIKDEFYDCIIHCAYNKELAITDYKKYLQDNIILTQKIKDLNYKKLIYISSIDVYKDKHDMYSTFKMLSETLFDKNDLILRCSFFLGNTKKLNHLHKIKNNIDLGLNSISNFNYILISEIKDFIINEEYLNYNGIIDFVSNGHITLNELKKHYKSESKFGDYHYNSNYEYTNPIYKLDLKYDKTSFEKLKIYENE
jgi:hypothetical protein